MAVNTAGYVCPFDAGNPEIITGIAGEVITAGDLCFVSGAADCVSSGINSFATADLMIVSGASGAKFNGVCTQGAVSGGACSIARGGIIIARAGGTTVGGEPVAANGADDFIPLASVSGANVANQITQAIKIKAGRAVTNATSGNYVMVQLTP